MGECGSVGVWEGGQRCGVIVERSACRFVTGLFDGEMLGVYGNACILECVRVWECGSVGVWECGSVDRYAEIL